MMRGSNVGVDEDDDEDRAAAPLVEIPIAYPQSLDHDNSSNNNNNTTATYVVNDVAGTVVHKQHHNNNSAATGSASPTQQQQRIDVVWIADKQCIMRGSSSVTQTLNSSSGDDGDAGSSNNKKKLLVTSALPDQPWILSVSLLSSTASSSKDDSMMSDDNDDTTKNHNNTTIHLDLGSACQHYRGTAKVHASCYRDDRDHIQLLCIDSAGTILSIHLDRLTLVPAAAMDVMLLRDVLEDTMMERVAPAPIYPSMIAVVPGSSAGQSQQARIIMSVNPFLVCIDLGQGHDGHGRSRGKKKTTATACVWSKTKCQAMMKKQAQASSGFTGKMWATTVDLVMGGAGSDTDDMESSYYALVDMNPVSAICLAASNDSQSQQAAVAFTLHSDGIIRRWTLPSPPAATTTADASGMEAEARHHHHSSSSSSHPYHVSELLTSSNQFPPNELWNDAIQMTARLYDRNRIFALAVHIEQQAYTNSNSQRSGDDNDNETSCCHLFLVDGDTSTTTTTSDQAAGGSSTTAKTTRLRVPSATSSIVGMEFDPTPHARCSLHVMAQTISATTKCSTHLHYPPSLQLMVHPEPSVRYGGYLLDQVAVMERQAITELSFGQYCLPAAEYHDEDEENNNDSHHRAELGTILHELDRRYLQYLFRPTTPRGVGSCRAPRAERIRHALRKLVPHYTTPHATTGRDTVSVEVETVRAMHEWRIQDKSYSSTSPAKKSSSSPRHHQAAIVSMTPVRQQEQLAALQTPGTDMAHAAYPATTPGTHASSIYDSLMPMDEDDDEDEENNAVVELMDDDDDDEDEEEDVEEGAHRDRVEAEIKTHERRWRQLLLEIWDEEEIDRSPTCVALLPGNNESATGGNRNNDPNDLAIVVRPGCTTVVTQTSAAAPADGDNGLMSTLDSIAIRLLNEIDRNDDYKALLHDTEQEVRDVVSRARLAFMEGDSMTHVRKAFMEVGRDALYDVLSPEESNGLIDGLKRLPDEELARALQASLLRSCQLLGLRQFGGSAHRHHSPGHQNIGADKQIRAASASFAVRCVDEVRRLLLGRCLVLCVFARQDVMDAALRLYLHSVSLLWTYAQQISAPTDPAPVETVRLVQQLEDSSPPHKRPSLGSGGAFKWGGEQTVSLLEALIMSVSRDALQQADSCSLSSSIAFLAGEAVRSSFRSFSTMGSENATLGQQLPELGALPCSSPYSVDHPKLALRLLAPFVNLRCSEDPEPLVKKRIHLLSECLLIACHTEPGERAKAMVQKACELLPFDAALVDSSMSNVDTLNRHLQKNMNLAGMLAEYVEGAIKEMENQYPQDALRHAPAYISLWSTLFHTAVSLQDWELAYTACVRNPESGRRASNFKRMVRALVDAGALSHLLDKCAALGSEAEQISVELFGKAGDFYAICCETLAEAAPRDLYVLLASESEPLSDYQAALYAVHVSQGNWRRAAQSMDLRFVTARNALDTSQSGSERLIVDDMVLGAIGCHNSICLEPTASSKFIISGEHGLYPSVPMTMWNADATGTKRSRGWQGGVVTGGSNSDDEDDRLSRYMDLQDLEIRAVRSSVLRTCLREDGADLSTAAKSSFVGKPTEAKDRAIIDELFARGYYMQGLLLGRSMDSARCTQPDGRGVFYDTMAHLLCAYLIPLVGDTGGVAMSRPTFAQITACLSATGGTADLPPSLACVRSTGASSLPETWLRTGAMCLLQRLTTLHTTREQPLAVEVAERMLNSSENVVSLPAWLDRFLIEGGCGPDATGLFAPRSKPGTNTFNGDPSALLSIYTKRGYYRDACRVVTTVLSDPSRKEKAASRVPEKGNIDFVPYNKIDLLWNLINIAVARGDFDDNVSDELQVASQQMEQSLEQHFDLLKISEMGLQSARALS